MGDRTYCSVTITKYEYLKLEKEFGGKDKFLQSMGCYEVNISDNLAEIADDQANYGNIEPLVNILQDNEIPYDKRWESGSEYSAGDEYARNVNGKYEVSDIYDDDYKVLTTLKSMLKEKDLLQTVKDKIKELEPFKVTPLHEPNSVRFIKDS